MTIGDQPKTETFKLKRRTVQTNGLDRYSLPQWQIVWRILMPPGQNGAVLLDAGAGEHEWTCSDYDIVRCDNWQQYMNREGGLPTGIDNVDLGAEPWPYEDDSFDGVISIDVLEHLENQWAFWRQAFRVARHFVIIATPNVHAPVSHVLFNTTERLWGFIASEVEHSRHITPVFRWQMEEAAKRAGWKLAKTHYANKPPLPQGLTMPTTAFTNKVMHGPNRRAVVALFRPER